MRISRYARHSSDLGNQRSTEDQLAALARKAESMGGVLAPSFKDEGISGASLFNRPGVKAMLASAARGEFDVLLTEALDRLSRDQEGTAHIFKRLTYYGVALETLSEGRITELHVGLSGTMNQMFLAELGRKTKRGLVARVQAGFSGGGKCYGYDIVSTGVLSINSDERDIIQRIFKEYAGGASPRAIAHSLNADHVAGPRGGDWMPSTIYGDRRAQDGILCQELYIGVRVFNRRRYRKHPDTGRRSSVLNKPEDWLREPVPCLRIIDDKTWDAVQARQKALAAQPAAYARRPKRLLSGLMKCSLCQSGMTLNGGKYACSANRERGTCTNGKIIAAQTVEKRVLAGIRTHLLSPDAIASAVHIAREEMDQRRHRALAERAPAERELAEINRRLERGQMMFMEDMISMEDLKAKTAPLAKRREELQAIIAVSPDPIVVQMHPGAAEGYRRLAENLHLAVEGDDGEDLRRELRQLIDHVDFIPLEGMGKFDLQVHGSLATLLRLGDAQTAQSPAASGSGALGSVGLTSGKCEVLVGAGVGFEPTTFRL
jgi:site-specific DNA recombinase